MFFRRVSLLVAGAIFSQGAEARLYRDLFVTPKGHSMGRAMTAITDDYNSLYFNPAGLANIQKWEIRLFDWGQMRLSSGILDTIKRVQAIDTTAGAAGLGTQLQQLDGTAASFGGELLGAGWYRNRMAVGLVPISGDMSLRVRTPSIMFAKVDVNVVADGGVSLGYAHPFYNNKLRVGAAVRPFLYRAGGEVNLEGAELLGITENLPEFIEENSQRLGAGWGYDFDIGAQGELDPIPVGRFGITPKAGIVGQNLLANKYSQPFSALGSFTNLPPALQRKINIGVAGVGEGLGVFRPTLSLEYRDLLVDTDKFYEHLHAGLDLSLTPKRWFTTSLRGHFYKGQLGGGIGIKLWKFDMEAGTYAESLGALPGIGLDRKFFFALSSFI